MKEKARKLLFRKQSIILTSPWKQKYFKKNETDVQTK